MQAIFDQSVSIDIDPFDFDEFDEDDLLEQPVVDDAPLDGRLDRLIEVGRLAVGADRATLFLYDNATDTLESHAADDAQAIRVAATEGVVGYCATTREVTNVAECYRDARFNRSVDDESGYRTNSLLALPLVSNRGALLGVLELLNSRTGVFDANAEQAAGLVAWYASSLIESSRGSAADADVDGYDDTERRRIAALRESIATHD